MAYSDKVVDHYNNPRNVGTLDKSSSEVGTGLVGAPECGDVMRLQIRVNPETQVIEEAKFKTFGCGSAIASSSLATEWIKGRTVDDAMAIKNTDIVKELSLPPVKIHCSVLAEDAIRARLRGTTKAVPPKANYLLRGGSCHGCCFGHAVLLLPVADRGANRVLGQHRAVNLHRRQRKFLHDICVLDL